MDALSRGVGFNLNQEPGIGSAGYSVLTNELENLHKGATNSNPNVLLAQVDNDTKGIKVNNANSTAGKQMSVNTFIEKKMNSATMLNGIKNTGVTNFNPVVKINSKTNSITPTGSNISYDSYTAFIPDALRQTYYDPTSYTGGEPLVPVENISGFRFAENYLQSIVLNSGEQSIDQNIVRNGRIPNLTNNADIGKSSFTRSCITWASAYSWDLLNVMINKENPLNPIDIIKEKSEFFIQSYQLARKRAVLTGFDKGNQAGLTNLTDFTFPLGNVVNNTTAITQPLYSLTADEFISTLGSIVDNYKKGLAYNDAIATDFYIPFADYIKCSLATRNNDFPVGMSRLDFMVQQLRILLGNPSLKVSGLPDFTKGHPNNASGKNIYMLFSKKPDCLSIIEPIPFTLGALGVESNGFNMSQFAFARFSGIVVKKTQTVLYATNTVDF